MLRSVTLIHWRSHAKTHIPLTRGANLLLGQMGAGKSSVVDGLCFALYGTYPKLGRREVRIDEVANFRHPGQTVAVEVEWDDENEGRAGGEKTSACHVYKIRRELSTSEAWLYADEKLVQKGPRAVSDEVEKLLGISYDLFSRAAYAEQNRLDAWLTLAPSARKAELDRLLGLDRFEQARMGATAEHNRLREKAVMIEQSAPAEKVEEEKKNLQERRAQLEARQLEFTARREESAAHAKEMASVQAEWERIDGLKRKKDELFNRLQKAAGTISAGEKMMASMAGLPAPAEVEKKLISLGGERKTLEQKLKEAQAAAGEESKRAGTIAQQIRDAKAKAEKKASLAKKMKDLLETHAGIEEVRKELVAAQAVLAETMKEAAALEAECKDAQKVLLAFEVKTAHAHAGESGLQSSVCPVCSTPLDEQKRKHLQETQEKKVALLQENCKAATKRVSEGHKKVEHISKLDADVGRLEAQLAALGEVADAAVLQKQLDESAAHGLKLSVDAKEISQKLQNLAADESLAKQTLSQINQVQEWQKQLDLARKEKEMLEAEMKALGFDEKAWGAQAARREELLAKKGRVDELARSAEKMAEQERQLVKMQQTLVQELEKKREEAGAARKEMDELAAFRAVLLATQTQLRARLLEEINSALTRLWPLIYPYGDWEKVRLVATDKDYTVEIHQGEWKSLEAHASGGERACLGLALRVVLSVLLTPSLGWLILDEPTHNLDAKAVQGLGVALAERIPQIIPQVIVITHEGALVESTPGRVIRFSRDKLRGEDTQVEIEGVT